MRPTVKEFFQAINESDEDAVVKHLDRFARGSVACVEEFVNDEQAFETPLHAAVKQAEKSPEGYDILERLLSFPLFQKEFLLRRDARGIAPLGCTRDFDVRALLFEYMPGDGDFDFGAVGNGDLAAVKKELDRGHDVNAVDRNGRTPLILAAQSLQPVWSWIIAKKNCNAFAMFKLILEHDPDIHIKDYYGNTAFACLIGPMFGSYLSAYDDAFDDDIRTAAELLLARNAEYQLPGMDSNYYPLEFRKMMVRFMLRQEPEYSTFIKYMGKK